MGTRNSKSVDIVTPEFKYDKTEFNTEKEVPKQSANQEYVEHTEDEMEKHAHLVPAWVTEEYFVDILKEKIEGFERITNFKAYPALKPGENYATLILRICIDIHLKDKSNQQLSFILKVCHDNEQMRQMFAIRNFFTPENEMYSNVIPEFEQMYKDAGLNVRLTAKSYKFVKDPGCETVLLEDLRPYGYKNTNRIQCLGLEHTLAVLKKLAQFHAASACRFANKGPYLHCLMDGFLSHNAEQMKQMFETMMTPVKRAFLEHIPTYKDGSKYLPVLEKYFETFNTEMWAQCVYDPNEFNVLNHGDAWSNNMLFKCGKDGSVDDVVFVDFQNSRYHSPVCDLYYFILSSVRRDIKLKHFDYFVRFYYDNLIEHLKLLHYPKKMPLLRELYIQFFKYNVMSVFTCMLMLPVVLVDGSDIANIDSLMGESKTSLEFQRMMFKNERYNEYISDLLPWLYNRGLLDPSDSTPVEATANTLEAIIATSEAAPTAAAAAATTLEVTTTTGQPKLEFPDWINEKSFTEILAANLEDFKKIKSFTVNPGTKAGDNFASLILRVDTEVDRINNPTEQMSFMLKVPPPGDQMSYIIGLMQTFVRELAVYNSALPQFHDLYRKAGMNVTFGPRCFKVDPAVATDVILMENLALHGFKTGDRHRGLDLEHTKFALHKLAQFHAASACLYANNGNIPEILLKNVYNEENREPMEKMIDQFYAPHRERFSSWEGGEEFKDKVLHLLKDGMDIVIKLGIMDPDAFNVLNHGDFWLNNMMFQYKANGDIADVYFVDYQMSQYIPPARDLLYFLISSIEFDIKFTQFDYFISYYHEELVKHLHILKYPRTIPTLKELHADLIRSGPWGFSGIIGPMVACCSPEMDKLDFEDVMQDNEEGAALQAKIYDNPLYRKRATEALTWLCRRGGLDLEYENA